MAKGLPGLLAVHFPARFESDPVIQELLVSVATIAGGFSLESQRGAYVREDTGQLQVEPVSVLVVCHAGSHDMHQSMKNLRHNIVRRLFELGEESVLVTYTYPHGAPFRGLIYNDKAAVIPPTLPPPTSGESHLFVQRNATH